MTEIAPSSCSSPAVLGACKQGLLHTTYVRQQGIKKWVFFAHTEQQVSISWPVMGSDHTSQEPPLELGDPNCPSSRKLQTTFPRAGDLGQLILSILDRRFRHMFPRHFPVFRGLLSCPAFAFCMCTFLHTIMQSIVFI